MDCSTVVVKRVWLYLNIALPISYKSNNFERERARQRLRVYHRGGFWTSIMPFFIASY